MCEQVVEGGGFELFHERSGAPGLALFFGGVFPGVVEAGLFEVGDHGAEFELIVMVCIEVAADDPAEDFVFGEFFFHFGFMGEDLFYRFGTCVGDVFFTFRVIAAAIAFEVDAIDHDESAGRVFEGGECETAAETG